MKTLPSVRQQTEPIPERYQLSYQEFAREFLYPNRPVILTDGLKAWQAVGKWSPEFFKNRFPGKALQIGDRSYSMEEFIQLVQVSGPDSPAPYFRNQFVSKVFPDLLADILPPPPYVLPNWHRGPFYPSAGYREPEIYIGGAGAGFPFLHYDSNSTHAFLGQVFGEKEAILYSPEDSPFVYAKEGTFTRHHSFINDVENPDFDRFPLFARAIAFRGVLKPGSLLFIPSRWWHTARMLSPSITISHNVANASNWSLVSDEVCFKARFKHPLSVPLVAVYMKLLGQGHALYDFIRR